LSLLMLQRFCWVLHLAGPAIGRRLIAVVRQIMVPFVQRRLLSDTPWVWRAGSEGRETGFFGPHLQRRLAFVPINLVQNGEQFTRDRRVVPHARAATRLPGPIPATASQGAREWQRVGGGNVWRAPKGMSPWRAATAIPRRPLASIFRRRAHD